MQGRDTDVVKQDSQTHKMAGLELMDGKQAQGKRMKDGCSVILDQERGENWTYLPKGGVM